MELPQKEPFRFIDGIEDLDNKKKKIICYQNFRKEMEFFQGHFPDEPIVPGVLIVESMAQSAILLSVQLKKSNGKQINPYLVKIENASFYNKLLPDTTIWIETKVEREVNNFLFVKSCVKTENGIKIAKSNLIAAT